jgi:sugar lactone lactonase YvrE
MESLVTHGLHISEAREGHSTLYAVGHGGREAVEVFDITLTDADATPRAAWVGCVLSPEGQEINSVTALADGSLLATVPLEHGRIFAEAMTGLDTGAVYRWSASSATWTRLSTTEQPYANGIAVSEDETVFYVASSGRATITAYRNDESAAPLWTSAALPIAPDNLRRDSSGRLFTAGLILDYADCDPYNEAGEFDLAVFATCPRPYAVYVLDPKTRSLTEVASGPANPSFSNATIGIVVDQTLWVGTFGGDRVAYRPLTPAP